MPQESPTPENPRFPQVPFNGGCLGFVFVLVLSVAVVSAIAAFNGEFISSLADREIRRNAFAAIAPLRIGSTNIGALALAGILGWEAIRLARRFIGKKAVWIDGDMIRFHATVRRRPLALSALDGIRHEAGDTKSVLVLEHSGGHRITIRAVDHDAAQAFVVEVERARAELLFG